MPHDIKHPDDILRPIDMVTMCSGERLYFIWLDRWMNVSKSFVKRISSIHKN